MAEFIGGCDEPKAIAVARGRSLAVHCPEGIESSEGFVKDLSRVGVHIERDAGCVGIPVSC